MRLGLGAGVLLLLAAACGSSSTSTDGGGGGDAGTVDSGAPDAGGVDAGQRDAGVSDAGSPMDAGAMDGGTSDAGATDGGSLCVGVTCTALDQCHVAGTCDPTTGLCSNPNAADLTPCCSGPLSFSCHSGVCGGGACTGLCLQQATCDAGTTTTLTGTVYAPNGVDPLPNVLVYVPNGAAGAPTWGVQPIAPGVACASRACGETSDVSGSPLVGTLSAADGTFQLTNVPAGNNIPVVLQMGRWRRKIAVPLVQACTTRSLGGMTAMPSQQAQADPADNIPLMAFVTGSEDTLECTLRKIGIADTEFSDPSGSGRVRFYLGSGAPGAQYSGTTPSETTLWGSQASINLYDAVFFACQGAEYDKTAAQQNVVINYANAGGRINAVHDSYVWLFNDAPFSGTATWNVAQADPMNDPQAGFINMAFPAGNTLAQWLQLIGASTTLGQVSLTTLRHDFDGVTAPSLQWATLQNDPTAGSAPMLYSFDTPVGAQPASQCGRVLFSDFHVGIGPTSGLTFPAECTGTAMSPEEKLVEYMVFWMGD